jgi:hypothetical protein
MVHTEEENPERHEHVWGEVRGHLRPCTHSDCNAERIEPNERYEQMLEAQIIFDM